MLNMLMVKNGTRMVHIVFSRFGEKIMIEISQKNVSKDKQIRSAYYRKALTLE